MDTNDHIAAHIARVTGEPFVVQRGSAVGGGCINTATVLEGDGRRYFVKLNDASRIEMFEAEMDGLEEIARTSTVRVPRPVCCGAAGGRAYIVMEYIRLGGGGRDTQAALGRALAAMHRCTAGRFGWHRDNTIGSTPQVNTPCSGWAEFYREHRLRFQLELAARNGYRGALQRDGARLLAGIEGFFRGYAPVASLLHGDLWAGNASADASGVPVIFDPAVYYGDREADIAMTELFGGFGRGFYDAYSGAWPLDAGYGVRRTLYNLYHVVNHLNLFGGGYLSQAEHMTRELLAELA
jgi:fructosamine-3-kinase